MGSRAPYPERHGGGAPHSPCGKRLTMPDPTLYLFDGWNILRAGSFRGREELVDRLAGFVALRGARGVAVFDGAGEDTTLGALEVRFVQHADELLERLAVEARNRPGERVVLVSSDRHVRDTAGREVRRTGSAEFARELERDAHTAASGLPEARIEDALDPETRERLERLRRGGA
jgi:predicted RNA-binding protein with PIN domain